jgi:hypothetical protein
MAVTTEPKLPYERLKGEMKVGLFAIAFLALGFQDQPSGFRPDPKPDANAARVLNVLRTKIAAAKSISGEYEVRSEGQVELYAFKVARPNFGRFLSKESAYWSDGQSAIGYYPSENEYFEQTASKEGLPAGAALNLGGVLGLEAIAFPNEPKLVPVKVSLKPFAGKACKAIEMLSPESSELKATLFIDAKTGIPAGWDYVFGEFKASGIYKKFEIDPAFNKGEFVWKKPAGAKKIE